MRHLFRVENIDRRGSNWPLGAKMCFFDPKIMILGANSQFLSPSAQCLRRGTFSLIFNSFKNVYFQLIRLIVAWDGAKAQANIASSKNSEILRRLLNVVISLTHVCGVHSSFNSSFEEPVCFRVPVKESDDKHDGKLAFDI